MGVQRLVFDGDIELIGESGSDYWFEALEGAEFGQPVPIEVVLTSLLRDGAIVSKTGDDNREMAFPLRVRGSDLKSLSLAEARLDLAIGKRTTLAWTPPDGYGPTTVFDVMSSRLDPPQFDGLAELRNQRTYTLRLTCLPFGRSVESITDDADTPSSTVTVSDSCESTTGWSEAYGGAIAVDSTIKAEGTGSIRITSSHRNSTFDSSGTKYSFGSITFAKTLSIATGAGGGYFSILVRTEWPLMLNDSSFQLTTTNTGKKTVSPVASEVVAPNFTRLILPVGASDTITKFEGFVYQQRNDWDDTTSYPNFWFDAIGLTAAATSDQQIMKVFTVEGSARAPGSLHIAAPSDSAALGQVFVATMAQEDIADGFRPDVRRYVTSGTTTTDSTALHGSYFTGSSTYGSAGSPIFDVPLASLCPGPYTVVALVKSGSDPLNVGVQAQLRMGGTSTGPTSEATVANVKNPTFVWRLVTIGTVYLPPVPVQFPDSTAVVRLQVQGSGVQFADLFVVPQAAVFSIVDCGTGTVSTSAASSHLWIDSPSPDQPQGGWWRGPAAARANARSAWPDAKKPGLHIFQPGVNVAHLVTTSATGPRIELEYWPHWRTNAAL